MYEARIRIQIRVHYLYVCLFTCGNILISAHLTGEMGGYTLDLLYSREELQLLLFLSNLLKSGAPASGPGRFGGHGYAPKAPSQAIFRIRLRTRKAISACAFSRLGARAWRFFDQVTEELRQTLRRINER